MLDLTFHRSESTEGYLGTGFRLADACCNMLQLLWSAKQIIFLQSRGIVDGALAPVQSCPGCGADWTNIFVVNTDARERATQSYRFRKEA